MLPSSNLVHHPDMKRSVLVVTCFLLCLYGFSQLKSPEAFLGYKVGAAFTPHAQVVNYFRYVAEQSPQIIKLQTYGKTNEGRSLLLTFISSAENIKNLESIRLNNLALTGVVKENAQASLQAPVIVWLSYNVHGNEPSSSEAAMLTLYALAHADAKTKEWLKNTVVVIDPCINPDGRDRYVNWFNSVAGTSYNPLPEAREHNEPWPGGRTNHYNFDLNRDWLWQTQVESQQRMKYYNAWMPQVHVDFHEQGINDPYYFAPAAQPFHEVITPWQRNFQMIIGKNHAKYFDANGWLYFTREIFDLYYPSYGDTYPMYNGAIGMTYEQGGGPRGGLGIITGAGDTLTLYDRVVHHFTTSLSTIEVASAHAAELVQEFNKFFTDAVRSPVGEYQTYVLRSDTPNQERLSSLISLLDNNGISYQTAASQGSRGATLRGFNYYTGKEENFRVIEGDVIISAAQPKSSLIKVLFEPRSLLVDSNTYDITAWSLPYIYGLGAYAIKSSVNIQASATAATPFAPNQVTDSYGYVIPWQGLKSAKVLTRLLKEKIKVRFSEQPFEVNGRKFERGSLILIKTSNRYTSNSLWETVVRITNEEQVKAYAVSTGFVDKGYDFGSSKIHAMKAPRVLMLTGESVNSNAAGQVWHFFEKQLGYPITLMNASDATVNNLSGYDVLILADGAYTLLSDRRHAEQLKQWISSGGKLIAMEGAAAQVAGLGWGIKLKTDEDSAKDAKKDPYQLLMNYENRERDVLKNAIPGSIFRLEMDNTHPLAFGYPRYYYTLKQDDRLYEYLDEDGWNVGVIRNQNQVAGFIGSKLKAKLKDGLIFGVLPVGNGNIIMLSDNPLFRSFWENGKLLFANAVFMVGQ